MLYNGSHGAGNARLVAILLLGALLAQTGFAQEAGLGVNAGYGHTNNLGRDAANEISSAFQTLGLDLDLGRESRRLNGSLNGDVTFYRYSEATVLTDDDEVLGSLDGKLAVELIPERFGWDLAANFGQARTDPLAAFGPRNRENVTILSTGPRIDIPLGGRSSLRLRSQNAERKYEDTVSLDSRTTSVQLGLFRAVSPVSQIGISFTSSEVDYHDLPEDQDYEFENVFLTYRTDFASGGIEARVGNGEVTVGAKSSSVPVMSFVWDRALGARSHLCISAGKNQTDAGTVFRLGGMPELGGPNTIGCIGDINSARLRDVTLVADPLERTSVGVGFDVNGERTGLSVSFGLSEDRFQVSTDLDHDGAYLSFSLSREFNPRWGGELQIRGWRQKFERTGQDDKSVDSRIVVSRELGSRAYIAFIFSHNSRDSERDSYDESVYRIALGYQFDR